MCKVKAYHKTSNTRIDKCMRHLCGFIEKHTVYKVKACCCGHNKYPATLVIHMIGFDTLIEVFSNTIIRRARNIYKRDKEGYYYIPEIIKALREKDVSDGNAEKPKAVPFEQNDIL